VVLGIGGCVIHNPYSSGYRDGMVQKFSKKGFVYKSWEGDLALAGSARNSQALGNVWHFTVSDTTVVEAIRNTKPHEQVRLHYNEYWWRPGLTGETNYRVTKIEKVQE
jgi:hypothetical protein